MTRRLTTILFGLVLVLAGLADSRADEGVNPLRLADDSLAYLTAPARWNGSDYKLLGYSVLALGLTATVDERFGYRDGDHANGVTAKISHILSGGGEITGWGGALAGGAYLTGLATGNRGVERAGFAMVESVLFAGAVTKGLKGAVGRSRPREGDDPFEFRPFEGYKRDSWRSFPSGHATTAFALAASASESLGGGVGWVAYPLAGLVALSRLDEREHWPSDLVAGGLIGCATGLWSARRLQGSGDTVSLAPFFQNSSTGLSLSVKF